MRKIFRFLSHKICIFVIAWPTKIENCKPSQSVVFWCHLMLLVFLLLEVFQSLLLCHEMLLLGLDLLLLSGSHLPELLYGQRLGSGHLILGTWPIMHFSSFVTHFYRFGSKYSNANILAHTVSQIWNWRNIKSHNHIICHRHTCWLFPALFSHLLILLWN